MTPPDHVTGLAPRGDLQRLLESLLVPGGPRPVAVAICDVVALKGVNEREGFLAGDAVLASAAAALRAAATDAILLARLGGDELVAVFTGPTAPAAASRAAASLVAKEAPRLHVAAVIAEPEDVPGSLIDRLYATMRRS
jgi:diguanylate cyclase (GGDEF)-like protein